ncbi:LPS export ABC transporter periplasmic protein LptC [Sphingosinicella rhizophila]|uniref:LPS export ABC transporter periplasmic protein LptC n=1 Tax=Sphingosinicella rhizophila TaxID=3050082 RepID=A0ABU3Q8Y2_9SPHN|nr:LPS export ABC transporter periplasmic protein LptC [Sphingosinicella sp. GR2756]MDT9599443.1 LPS export ABC transporter periplasmic protein LptC [Sphingosinicella sp. GR2756]
MSELAERERLIKRGWAAPGSFHDVFVRLLKIALPAGIGVLAAYLAISPLQKDKEVSFLLDKNKVEVARERLRLDEPQYRGQDDKGRPFLIRADQAIQATSKEQVMDIEGMDASIRLADGPAVLRADRGRYDMDAQTVDVLGPILFTAADGYRLETSDVQVDLNKSQLASQGSVKGRMPLGRFTADRMSVDLPARQVTLTGRARLHIVQGAIK